MPHRFAHNWTQLLAAASAVLVMTPAGVMAQDEDALRAAFEGKRVVLRIDMPGTSDGIDIRPDSRQPLDYERYRDKLRRSETAIHAGDGAIVTRVKVKSDLIEFQLGGGGFGTFWDDSSTSVYIPLVEKSDREKRLEDRIRDEHDREKRRELGRELDELRERRERENRRIMAERAAAEERKKSRIIHERRSGGSRFNLRYDEGVPSGIRPEEIVAALADYVDFGGRRRTQGCRQRPRILT